MKKLNITKEGFEKSKYFTSKYGKLEYVSESGKLFKTNKGKILMFKESIKDIAPGIQDWGTTVYVEPLEVEMSWDDVYYIVKKDCRQYPLLEEELGLEPYEEPTNNQIKKWIKTKPESFIDYLKEFGSYNATDFSGDDEYDESTKKFGKKFTKESASDIAHDPAYQCPYCGSRDCEFDDAEDIGTGLTDGYFDGATFNAQFWCNDCNKPYNVTFELKVKDVYPNEEENLEIDLPGSELEDDDL